MTGDPQQGYELAKRAIRLNPHMPWYHTMLGRCSFVLGRVPGILGRVRPNPARITRTLVFLAMAHAMLDETAAGCKRRQPVEGRDFPDFAVDTFIKGYPVTNPPASDGNP